MERTERCVKCKFWEKHAGGSSGFCLRYPQQVVWGEQIGVQFESPIMNDDEWCGEFRSIITDLVNGQGYTAKPPMVTDPLYSLAYSPSGEAWKSVAEDALAELRLVFQGTPQKPALIPDFCKPGQDMVKCLVPFAKAYLSNLNRIKTLESRLKMMTKTVNQWSSNDDPEQF
jgi:hypothetical protein